MAENYVVSSSPHIKSAHTTSAIMWNVVLALIPAWAFGIYYFGQRALWLTLLAVISAVATEALIQAFRKVPITITDGSAVITGMLLAFNLPPGVPWWLVVVGSFVGISIGKQVFGGLGYNPLNPALVGRAFLMASWPVHMTTDWIRPRGGSLSGVEAITTATPLNAFKLARKTLLDPESATEKIQQAQKTIESLYGGWQNFFFGNIGGCIGEVAAIAILIGGLYLIIRGFADWRIPLGYIGGIALFGWLFNGASGFASGNILFSIFTGGVFLGAFFMATDMVTSPITKSGRWIFGLGGALIATFIRRWGGYPEGVCYSILIMNILTPIIDRHTKPKVFGFARKGGDNK